MKVRRITAIAAGAVAALAIGGAALAAGDDDPAVPLLPNGDVAGASPRPTFSPSPTDAPSPSGSASPDATASASPDATAPARTASGISVDRARAIALRAAGGGRVTKIERETEHGRAVFEIEVSVKGVEHDLHVDRVTGGGHGSDD